MTSNDLGGEEISEMNLFFPMNHFRIIFFSSARPLKIYFFLGKASQHLFFNRQGLSKFIFPSARPLKISWRMPLKINFFLESASQNYFFPGECLSKFIFSWTRASEFFSRFPPLPQIITGHPLISDMARRAQHGRAHQRSRRYHYTQKKFFRVLRKFYFGPSHKGAF